MIYYRPILRVGVLLPDSKGFDEKFGGFPWGISIQRWPKCQKCRTPMTFLFQFRHDPFRMNLGAPGRFLYGFQCSQASGCIGVGGNAVVILSEQESIDSEQRTPEGTLIEPEARIVGWEEANDGITEADYPRFFDDAQYCEVATSYPKLFTSTKLKGGPVWIQHASESPTHPFVFAGQFDSSHCVIDTPPTADEIGCRVVYRSEKAPPFKVSKPTVERQHPCAPSSISVSADKTRYYFSAANYGDAGMGYLFINPDKDSPEGLFFWQCS